MQFHPAWRPDPWVLKTWHSAQSGPTAAVWGLCGACVPLTCPLMCFFAGKRGFGRDHVLPLLPAHSRQAYPHSDQVSEPQGDGHHRILRYLSYPSGLPAASQPPSHLDLERERGGIVSVLSIGVSALEASDLHLNSRSATSSQCDTLVS